MDISGVLDNELKAIKASATEYFGEASSLWLVWREMPKHYGHDHESKDFLENNRELKGKGGELQSEIARWAAKCTIIAQASALLSSADISDFRIDIRKMVAALHFKEYRYFEARLMSYEDTVYGVDPASQQELYIDVRFAAGAFDQSVGRIEQILLFVNTDPSQHLAPSQVVPSVSGAQIQRRDTAFIMMWMSDEHPELADVKAAIVEVFREFDIQAIRADDIEHDDVITERIKQEIVSAEFLIADLTGARPNVYYEVGYAHALGKRVILYRNKNAELHFDLAGRNVPVYVNIKDLKEKLRVRLEAMLGFESSYSFRLRGRA